MAIVNNKVKALHSDFNYGPGKFEGGTAYDADMYDVSMQGSAFMVTGPDGEWVDLVEIDPDTDGALATVATWALIREDSNGFVYVTYYDDTDEAHEAFNGFTPWDGD